MKVKLFRKVLRQARNELGRMTVFVTENGRVCQLRRPIGRGWVYDWMLGERLDIYVNPRDAQFAINKIARILWDHELREYWKSRVKAKGGAK